MNFKYRIAIVITLTMANANLLKGQTIYPSNEYAQCPENTELYTIVVPNDGISSAHWYIENGVFPYDNNSTSVWNQSISIYVKWNDGPTTGKLNLDITYNNGNVPRSVEKYFVLKRIKGATPEVTGISSCIDVGVTDLDLGVTLNYPNSTEDDDPYRVETIKFILPVGWSYKGVVSNGSNVYTKSTTGQYSIYTDDSSGGSFTLWGETDCSGASDSNVKTINILRRVPDFNISLSTENSFVEGNTTPFTASAPTWAEVSYNWTVPASWSYTGSGSSIVITPDGCTDGEITLRRCLG